MIEPGRFDPLTAYAAVNTLRIDDQNPHLFRTHDGGKTWTEIVNGIPGGAAGQRDPRRRQERKGLLFAGSETQVYVSFDDGDHWESLRLNMAPSSVRDLQVKDDDLVAGTHGRGIWILDDITPLRQIDARRPRDGDFLFKPQASLRVRWNTNTDTPLPPDEPRMPNPPEGGHHQLLPQVRRLGARSSLEIVDAAAASSCGAYSSDGPGAAAAGSGDQRAAAALLVPRAAVRSRPRPGCIASCGTSTTSRCPAAAADAAGLPIAAIPFNTAPAPTTPWAPPGQYTVKLTVNGKTLSQPLTVKQDPRVKTPALAMQQVYTLSTAAYREAANAFAAAAQAQQLRELVAAAASRASGDLATALTAFAKKVEEVSGTIAGGGGRGGRGAAPASTSGAVAAPPPPTLSNAATALSGVMNVLQAADVQPTAVQLKAIAAARRAGTAAMARWTAVKTVDLTAINAKLKAAGLQPITVN